MTPQLRRELLVSNGYQVARDCFPGTSGPLWYWSSLDRESVTRPKQRGFIDLRTGHWRWWDDPNAREFAGGPWSGADAGNADHVEKYLLVPRPDSPAHDPAGLITDFIAECLAAGLVLMPGQTLAGHSIDGWDTGNRYLLWRDRRYLASTRTRRLHLWERSAPWQPLTLADLVGPSGTPPESAPTPAADVEFLGNPRAEVVHSGNRKQTRLF